MNVNASYHWNLLMIRLIRDTHLIDDTIPNQICWNGQFDFTCRAIRSVGVQVGRGAQRPLEATYSTKWIM